MLRPPFISYLFYDTNTGVNVTKIKKKFVKKTNLRYLSVTVLILEDVVGEYTAKFNL
jgi:hypothetical protein